MTYLMVNLNDPGDCRQALEQIRETLRHGCGPGGKRRGRRGEHAGPPRPDEFPSELPHEPPHEPRRGPEGEGPARRRPPRHDDDSPEPRAPHLHDLPLPKKLDRISQRGVFRHLQRIATEVHTPMSLPELDRQLGFQPNKMRSLKAIMAKLEHRFGLQFLVPDPEGGVDENSNPRYVMPQRMRNQILRVAA
jgi:hypothetical protein